MDERNHCMPEEIEHAEDQLEQIVLRSPQPTSPASAIGELKSLGIREEIARASIWFLIDRGQLRLTEDRMLARPTNAPQPISG